MKNNYVFTWLLISSLLLSCGKDDINTSPSNALIKTLNIEFPSSPGILTTYTYDNQNRVKFIIDNSDDSTVFDYSDKLIMEHRFSALGVLNSSNLYYLNSQGLVDSAVLNNIQKNMKISYDSNGYPLVKKIYYQNGSLFYIDSYTVENGNIIREEIIDQAGKVLHILTNSYDLNKLSSIENKNFGQGYFGNYGVNVVSQVIITGSGVNDIDYEIYYDSQGRISKELSINANTKKLYATYSYDYY